MRIIWRLLIFALFISLLVYTYRASAQGLGMKMGLQDADTMTEIEKNCPDYYLNQNGDCLHRTFRSYFLIRGVRGGGPGSGK